MKINYTRERALEEAVDKINSNCLDFARIELLADEFTGVTVQVAWPNLGRVDPYLAKDCADELGWVADMASALDGLNIEVDYSQDEEELTDDEYFDLTSEISRAVMDASWRKIRDALQD